MKTTKVETGTLLMKDRKGWGVVYEDGYSTSYWWTDPSKLSLNNPKWSPPGSDPARQTYKGDHRIKEMQKGKVVLVRRTITMEWDWEK